MTRLITLLAVLAACLVPALAPASAGAATPPQGFFGLGGWSYPTTPQAVTLSQAGLHVFRGALAWGDIEAQQGTRNWANADALVTKASRYGFQVLFDLNGCAPWACGTVKAAPSSGAALTEYQSFVTAAVQRYGTGGTFWATHPALQPAKVMWQVWNEVNGGEFWPHPTAAAYASFLSTISATIKAADHTALVVESGLVEKPGDSSGVFLTQFLSDLYKQPGYTSSFDVAAVHGYAANPQGTFHILDETRRIMLENGDGNRPLWVTEMSWATGGPPHPFTSDEPTQDAYLRTAWDTMLACRARWNLQKVMWFGLNDFDGSAIGEPDYWGFHNGLLHLDGTPKPAFADFLTYLGNTPLPNGRGDVCSLPGGNDLDITDPTTTITSAPTLTNNLAGATVSFTASEDDVHYECSLDSSDWTPCSSPYPVDSTREGEHDIRVRAIDAEGNVDPSPATAQWMLDLTPPGTNLISRTPMHTSDRQVTVTFTATDAVGVAGYQCRVDTGDWTACTSPYTSPVLSPGQHEVDVRAYDASGNFDPSPVNPTFVIAGASSTAKTTTAKTGATSSSKTASKTASTTSKSKAKTTSKTASSKAATRVAERKRAAKKKRKTKHSRAVQRRR